MEITDQTLQKIVTALNFAQTYIAYVKSKNRHFHKEADGTPSANCAIQYASDDLKTEMRRNLQMRNQP